SPLIALASSGMPVLEQRVQARRAVGATQLVTELAVGEHLRKLGQQLQVLLGGVLGHEQHEHLRDGLAVGRVECNGRGEARECSLRGGEAPDATVRNGDALAEARRAELLACGQAVDHQLPRQPEVRLEQRADRLEQPRLARGFQPEQHIRGRQKVGDLAHRAPQKCKWRAVSAYRPRLTPARERKSINEAIRYVASELAGGLWGAASLALSRLIAVPS